MDIIMNDILRDTNNLEIAGKVLYDNIKKRNYPEETGLHKYEWSILASIYTT